MMNGLIRHPYLPYDFDFQYWNGAPADQQILYPKTNFTLKCENLTPQGYLQTHYLSIALLFYCVCKMAYLFYQIEFRHACYWCWKTATCTDLSISFWSITSIRVCEARFEINPDAPLVRFAQPQQEQTHGW